LSSPKWTESVRLPLPETYDLGNLAINAVEHCIGWLGIVTDKGFRKSPAIESECDLMIVFD
jgi:hypothetical protein